MIGSCICVGLSSVTAAHERCLCLQLETLRVADQFQLLLSTHIFVSMISSAVCNAVCALDDSALEALAKPFHPPLFHYDIDVSDFHAGVVRRHPPLTVRLGRARAK